MKRVFLILPIALMTIVTSCGSEEAEAHEEAVVAKDIESKTYEINTENSTVVWTGSKAIGSSHTGTINITSGSFVMKEDKIESGQLTIDMASIVVTDLTDSTENADLTGHLTTGDFFNIAEFPIATISITDGSDMNNVKANLTIKDKTEPITFALSTSKDAEKLNLTTKISFDRTKFGIIYGSGNFFEGLGDKIINDNIDLAITLITK